MQVSVLREIQGVAKVLEAGWHLTEELVQDKLKVEEKQEKLD